MKIICGNVRCRQEFENEMGRTGRPRKFCSAQCAKNQTQRNYRVNNPRSQVPTLATGRNKPQQIEQHGKNYRAGKNLPPWMFT